MINENKLLKKLKRAQILSYIAAAILFAVLILVIAKCSFAGTVTIINPTPAKLIKPKLPDYIAGQKITVKGFLNIGQLEFFLSDQLPETVELIGSSKTKSFVNFQDAKLITVLKYIKDVYGFNYKLTGESIKLDDVETKVFHLPLTPLINTVSASLGSSGQGQGINGASNTSSSAGTAASSSMGSGSSSSIGGYASEQVSNINTPFFKKFIKNVKSVMGKNSSVMFDARMSTLVVRGKVKRVELVKKYVREIDKRIGKVVFINLKVINVQLSSGFVYGINWSNLYNDMGHYLGAASSIAVNLSNTPVSGSLNGSDNIIFNSGTGTQSVITALNNFGKTRIVNQAKLELLSGQTRSLNNINVIPYSIGNQITSIGALGSTSQSTPQMGQATSGVNVIYTPEVLRKKVYISVQLILNTISGFTQFANGGTAPDVSTQSVSFTISVPSGKSALVGALQYKSVNNNKEGVPILDDIPILGYLFSGVSKADTNNELFLLITPVIIKG